MSSATTVYTRTRPGPASTATIWAAVALCCQGRIGFPQNSRDHSRVSAAVKPAAGRWHFPNGAGRKGGAPSRAPPAWLGTDRSRAAEPLVGVPPPPGERPIPGGVARPGRRQQILRAAEPEDGDRHSLRLRQDDERLPLRTKMTCQPRTRTQYWRNCSLGPENWSQMIPRSIRRPRNSSRGWSADSADRDAAGRCFGPDGSASVAPRLRLPKLSTPAHADASYRRRGI